MPQPPMINVNLALQSLQNQINTVKSDLTALTARVVALEPPMLAVDHFNRPDGPIGSAETGQVWGSIDSPTTPIVGGAARPLGGHFYLDVGTTNIRASVIVRAYTTAPELIWNVRDPANYLYDEFYIDTDGWHLLLTWPRGDGTFYRTSRTGAVSFASGGKLTVVTNDDALKLLVNDAIVFQGAYSVLVSGQAVIMTRDSRVGFGDVYTGPNDYTPFIVTAP